MSINEISSNNNIFLFKDLICTDHENCLRNMCLVLDGDLYPREDLFCNNKYYLNAVCQQQYKNGNINDLLAINLELPEEILLLKLLCSINYYFKYRSSIQFIQLINLKKSIKKFGKLKIINIFIKLLFLKQSENILDEALSICIKFYFDDLNITEFDYLSLEHNKIIFKCIGEFIMNNILMNTDADTQYKNLIFLENNVLFMSLSIYNEKLKNMYDLSIIEKFVLNIDNPSALLYLSLFYYHNHAKLCDNLLIQWLNSTKIEHIHLDEYENNEINLVFVNHVSESIKNTINVHSLLINSSLINKIVNAQINQWNVEMRPDLNISNDDKLLIFVVMFFPTLICDFGLDNIILDHIFDILLRNIKKINPSDKIIIASLLETETYLTRFRKYINKIYKSQRNDLIHQMYDFFPNRIKTVEFLYGINTSKEIDLIDYFMDTFNYEQIRIMIVTKKAFLRETIITKLINFLIEFSYVNVDYVIICLLEVMSRYSLKFEETNRVTDFLYHNINLMDETKMNVMVSDQKVVILLSIIKNLELHYKYMPNSLEYQDAKNRFEQNVELD